MIPSARKTSGRGQHRRESAGGKAGFVSFFNDPLTLLRAGVAVEAGPAFR